MPSTNAADTTPHFTPPCAAPVGSWANADTANSSVTAAIMMILLFTPILLSSNLISVFFRRDGTAEVHHRQHDEDECLQDRPEDSEGHHRPGDDDRNQPAEDAGGGMFAKDIAEKTHAQREDAGKVSDDLDHEHEREQPPDRTAEVFQIVQQALGLDALIVVIEEGGECQSEGRVRIAGGRLQEVEEAEDVRDENEDCEGPDDVQEDLTFLPDDVVQKVFQSLNGQLQDVLQRTGVLLADPPGGEPKDDAGNQQHQRGHDHMIGNVPDVLMLHAVPERVDGNVQKRTLVFHAINPRSSCTWSTQLHP